MTLRTTIKHLHCNHSLLKPLTSSRSFSYVLTHPPPPQLPHPPPNSNVQNQDPYSLLKEDPIQICSALWVKSFSSPPNTSFSNLTGFISKLDLWVLAYQRSYSHVTGTFPPRNAIHSHVLSDLLSLRNAVVRGQFAWNNKTHQLIRSPNEPPHTRLISKRKLQAFLDSDETCFQDRLVQEVLVMVLEPVFEARFSPKSHAFRPGRSAHTVIRTIR